MVGPRPSDEIRLANVAALSGALERFRAGHPHALIGAHTGWYLFEKGDQKERRSTLEKADVFAVMLASEYWASDVPHANFWRSVDLNGDQSMANLTSLGWPVERADPFSACFSTTWYVGAA
jgi:hypothetical protein